MAPQATTETTRHPIPGLAPTYLARFDDLLADLARLRRRARDDEYTLVIVDRIHGTLETIDCILWPSAGELVQAGRPVEQALMIVDRRSQHVRDAA
jgi:hypothetical protein